MRDRKNSLTLRPIDRELLDLGIEKRAQLLNDFLQDRLRAYKESSKRTNSADARGFGRLLAQASKDFLEGVRKYKLSTNWTEPPEEEQMLHRTTEMGEAYYLASPGKREEIAKKVLQVFSELPLPLEELAIEDKLIQSAEWDSPTWKDMPEQERRAWLKMAKHSPILNWTDDGTK